MVEEKYMRRALELAKGGLGHVSPNPIVGCVIVHEGKIIGEGFHQKYGEAHAEVNAVRSVRDPSLLSESTVYVTLEPCAHFGKTPPCADLLIQKEVKQVVIACQDPFFEVDGKGKSKLRKAGVDVLTGMLEHEAEELNRRFFTYHEEKRPYVILKWAETADGFIARKNYDSKWISSDLARQLVHKWRSEEDAILVGKNTAIHDQPSLTVRDWTGRNPKRILLDRNLQVSEEQPLFDENAPTFIFNEKEEKQQGENQWIRVRELTPKTVLAQLYDRSIQSVIVEGGSQVLNSFIKDDCWNEARVFYSEANFIEGIRAPKINGLITERMTIGSDTLRIVRRHG